MKSQKHAKYFKNHSFYIIVLVTIALGICLGVKPTRIQAQEDEPFVQSIDPTRVTAGSESFIIAQGEDFTAPLTVTLFLNGQIQHELDADIVSTSQIHVDLDADIPPGNYRLQFRFANATDRFPFDVISSEPVVESVAPIEFWNKQPTELTIRGSGLTQNPLVILGTEQIYETQVVSETLMTATIPAGFESGSYRLSFIFGDGDGITYANPLTVNSYIQPRVQKVAPELVYNNKERTLILFGEGLQTIESVQLGGQPLEINSRFYERSSVTIPANFQTGSYQLILDFQQGDQVILEKSITVRNALNPVITNIEPTDLVTNGEGEILVEGKRLDQVTAVLLRGDRWREDCEIINKDEHSVRLQCDTNTVTDRNAENNEEYDLSFFFPDDTSLEKEILIHRSLLPSTKWGWVGWLLLLITSSISCIVISSFVNKKEHRRNHTAPSGGIVLGVTLGTAILLAGIGVALWILWKPNPDGFTTGQFRYLGIWLLAGATATLAFKIARWTGYFYKIASDLLRFTIASGIAMVALIAPVILNQGDFLQWVIWIEVGLVVFVTALGVVGLRYTQSKLEEIVEDKWPGTETALAQIVRKLRRQGTVAAETDFADYPMDKVCQVMEDYVTNHRYEQGLNYIPTLGKLSFERKNAVHTLNRSFEDMQNVVNRQDDNQIAIKQAATDLADTVRDLLEFDADNPFHIKNISEDFSGYNIVSQQLESVLPTPFPLILFHSTQAISHDEIGRLKEILIQLNPDMRFSVLLTIGADKETQRVIHRRLVSRVEARENIAVIGIDDLIDVLVSRQAPYRAFLEVVREQVDWNIFSPYQTRGPIKADMFFGRREEIAAVLESIDNNSVAVLGARRIGKTSMLNQISRVLRKRGYFLLYMNCERVSDYQGFFDAMNSEWQAEIPDLDFGRYTKIRDFTRLVNDLRNLDSKRRIVFQFDEVDRLFLYDTKNKSNNGDLKATEELIRTFRSLAERQHCQFIFSGERTILEKMDNPQSRFYNFPEAVYPQLLDRETTERLVCDPMNLLGISFQTRDKAVDFIHKQTAGHPNLIQLTCDSLLKQLQRSQTLVVIFDLVQRVINDRGFQKEYLDTFWSQAMPIEKAMSVVAAKIGTANERTMLHQLNDAGYQIVSSDIERGIRYLTLSQLLIATEDGYRIQPKLFPKYLFNRYSYIEWLEDFKQQVIGRQ